MGLVHFGTWDGKPIKWKMRRKFGKLLRIKRNSFAKMKFYTALLQITFKMFDLQQRPIEMSTDFIFIYNKSYNKLLKIS